MDAMTTRRAAWPHVTGPARHVLPRAAIRNGRAAWAGLLLGVLAVLGLPATPALAHATQLSTDPPAGAVLSAAPAEVVVRFSEPIQVVPARTSVTGPDGARADRGRPRATGHTLHIPLRPTGPRGTYLVSYRVISADGHPVGGGWTYSVGAPSASAPNQPATGGAPVDPVVLAALAIARYLSLAGAALVVGAATVLAGLWPRRLPRAGPARLAWAGMALVAASTLAELYVQAPHTTGAALFAVSGGDLRAVLASQFGGAHVVRLGVLAAAAFPLRALLAGRAGRADRVLLGLLAAVAAVTWPLSGHPGATTLTPLTVLADAAHLAAMAVWLGGLVMLTAFLLPRGNRRELSAILPVWSRRATWAVVVLGLAGVVQAVVEIGSFGALVDTAYGRLVLAKSALFAAVLGAAWFARRVVLRPAAAPAERVAVPAGAAGGPPAGEPVDPPEPADAPAAGGPGDPARDPAPGTGRLRRAVLVEIAIVAVILALTAVLVQTTPGRNARAAAQQARQPPSYTLSTRLYSLQVDLDPAETGENSLHMYAYAPDGRPIAVKEWRVTAALPAANLGPVQVTVLPITDSHAIGQVSLPRAGSWEFRFTLRTTEIDEATVGQTVAVR